MLQKNFTQVWEQLRAKKRAMPEFLENVTLKNFRGIADLSVNFEFPVSVLAGPNACGKTIVLFACACAYENGKSSFTPTILFPNLNLRKNPEYSDSQHPTEFDYFYTHQSRKTSMRWGKGKSWNRTFMGQIGASQPSRMALLHESALS